MIAIVAVLLFGMFMVGMLALIFVLGWVATGGRRAKRNARSDALARRGFVRTSSGGIPPGSSGTWQAPGLRVEIKKRPFAGPLGMQVSKDLVIGRGFPEEHLRVVIDVDGAPGGSAQYFVNRWPAPKNLAPFQPSDARLTALGRWATDDVTGLDGLLAHHGDAVADALRNRGFGQPALYAFEVSPTTFAIELGMQSRATMSADQALAFIDEATALARQLGMRPTGGSM